MTIMVAQGRIRGMGRLRYSMGDAELYQIPQIAAKPDMDHVFSPDELGQIVFSSGDEAIAYYTWLVRTIAIQTKIAFAVDLWKTVKQSPEMVGALAITESGRAWLNVFANSEAAFISFTQPNLFQNLQLVRNYMEVNLLPQVYKLGVKGRLPVFIAGAQDMSYTDVLVDSSTFTATINFGDLSSSTVKDDVDRVNELAGKFAPSVKLGVWPTIVVVIVAIVAVILSTYIFVLLDEYIQAKKIPPEVAEALKKADPATVERILEKWGKMSGFFGGLSDALMWGAIGLGVIVVGGTVLWIASK